MRGWESLHDPCVGLDPSLQFVCTGRACANVDKVARIGEECGQMFYRWITSIMPSGKLCGPDGGACHSSGADILVANFKATGP